MKNKPTLKSELTVDYFIEKFKAIPLRKWTKGKYQADNGALCALGHCGVGLQGKMFTAEGNALVDLFSAKYISAPDVNDGYNLSYPQKTPKARILAALKDIKG